MTEANQSMLKLDHMHHIAARLGSLIARALGEQFAFRRANVKVFTCREFIVQQNAGIPGQSLAGMLLQVLPAMPNCTHMHCTCMFQACSAACYRWSTGLKGKGKLQACICSQLANFCKLLVDVATVSILLCVQGSNERLIHHQSCMSQAANASAAD